MREEISSKLKDTIHRLEKFVNFSLGYKVRVADDQELFDEFMDFVQRNWIEPTLEKALEHEIDKELENIE